MFWLIWTDLPNTMLGILCSTILTNFVIVHPWFMIHISLISHFFLQKLYTIWFGAVQNLGSRYHMSIVRGLLDTVHNWNLNIFAIAQCTLRVQPNLVSSISQLAKIKLNLLSSCSAYESGLVYRRGDFKIYLFAHTN